MYPWIVKYLTSPLWEVKNGLAVKKCIRELEMTQWYSPEQLKELQLVKLKKLLQHCYTNIPYYRNLFNDRGLSLNDIHSPDDLSKIPILTKNDVQGNLKQLIAKDKHRPYIVRKTSGSTATPLVTYIDKQSLSYQIASQLRGRNWWGWTRGEKFVSLRGRYSNEHNTKKIIRDYIIENKILLSSFDLTQDSIKKYYTIIKKFKPQFMYAWCTAIYTLAQIFKENQLNLSKLKLRGISTTSEILYDHHRSLIESVFDCPVINEYGCAEVGIISFQCPIGGMHLMSENLIVEFVRDHNRDYPEQLGDIVVTDLNNYSMPLLRYKTGDLGSNIDGPCTCGRGLPIMSITIGRKYDMVILKNDKLVYPGIFAFMMAKAYAQYGSKIKKFQVVQQTKENFLIRTVVESGFEPIATKFFKNAFQTQLGNNLTVDFEFLDHIAKDKSGKFREFVSELKRT